MKAQRLVFIVINFLLLSTFTLNRVEAQTYSGDSTAFVISSEISMPAYLSRDPAYWYRQYLIEQARADGLARTGSTAIKGLQASLKAANDTLAMQYERTVLFSDEIGHEAARAEAAEQKLEPLTKELGKYKGKTLAGQALRKFRNKVLAPVGGVLIVAGVFGVFF